MLQTPGALRLQQRARAVIPNGMYGHQSTVKLPEGYPQFFTRADGTRLWDSDGRGYIDFMAAYGPNLLGYNHPEVDAAMKAQMALGDTMTGPSPVMVDLAEALVGMISHADWAMFCKNGADATSMALVVARAHTGRRKVLMARGAYHGSHLWNTPNPAGTVPEDRAHILYYDYNDPDALEIAANQAGDDLAAIFTSPYRHDTFADQEEIGRDYATTVRRICYQHGALLVLDEVRAGFRLSRDGAWDRLGVPADLSCWGKVLANGQPISALLGADKLRAAAGDVFVTGSFWFSAVPMAAAIETLRIIRESDYLKHIHEIGATFRAGLDAQAKRHGVKLRQSGPVSMPMVLFEDDPKFKKGNRWCQIALENGVWLSPYHNMFINAAMTRADIDEALDATDIAFTELKKQWSSL